MKNYNFKIGDKVKIVNLDPLEVAYVPSLKKTLNTIGTITKIHKISSRVTFKDNTVWWYENNCLKKYDIPYCKIIKRIINEI